MRQNVAQLAVSFVMGAVCVFALAKMMAADSGAASAAADSRRFIGRPPTPTAATVAVESPAATVKPTTTTPFNPLAFMDDHSDSRQLGPVMKEEALLLHAAVRMAAPKRLLEFGFSKGSSAKALLSGCYPACKLTSYDILPWPGLDGAAEAVTNLFGRDHFEYIVLNQSLLEPTGQYDFIYIDASHDLDLNANTWNKLLKAGAFGPNAIIAVHDTGIWPGDLMPREWEGHRGGKLATCNKVPQGGVAHQPDEIKFVEWIVRAYPSFVKFDFVSANVIRHGVTFLQEKAEWRIDGKPV